VVDSSGQLVAVTRSDGRIRWATKLGDGTWAGPVLAGNRLWLASSKGQLVGVEPENGRVATTESIGDKVLIGPVVAGRHLYVLSDSARLYAFN
jgi:outer membrane protein assembly factor BamB